VKGACRPGAEGLTSLRRLYSWILWEGKWGGKRDGSERKEERKEKGYGKAYKKGSLTVIILLGLLNDLFTLSTALQ